MKPLEFLQLTTYTYLKIVSGLFPQKHLKLLLDGQVERFVRVVTYKYKPKSSIVFDVIRMKRVYF